MFMQSIIYNKSSCGLVKFDSSISFLEELPISELGGLFSQFEVASTPGSLVESEAGFAVTWPLASPLELSVIIGTCVAADIGADLFR